MKKLKHDYLNCQGNICQTHPVNSETTWIPGEPICSTKPYKKFQKVQAKINRFLTKGKLKNSNSYFYLADLEKVKRVTPAIVGITFDSRTDRDPNLAKKQVFNVRESNPNRSSSTTTSSQA